MTAEQYHRGDLILETGTRVGRVGVVVGGDNGETVDVRWFDTRTAPTKTFKRSKVERIKVNAVTVFGDGKGEHALSYDAALQAIAENIATKAGLQLSADEQNTLAEIALESIGYPGGEGR